MTNSSTPTPTTSPIVPAPGLAPGPIGGLQVLLEALFIAIRPPALTLAIIPFFLNVLGLGERRDGVLSELGTLFFGFLGGLVIYLWLRRLGCGRGCCSTWARTCR